MRTYECYVLPDQETLPKKNVHAILHVEKGRIAIFDKESYESLIKVMKTLPEDPEILDALLLQGIKFAPLSLMELMFQGEWTLIDSITVKE